MMNLSKHIISGGVGSVSSLAASRMWWVSEQSKMLKSLNISTLKNKTVGLNENKTEGDSTYVETSWDKRQVGKVVFWRPGIWCLLAATHITSSSCQETKREMVVSASYWLNTGWQMHLTWFASLSRSSFWDWQLAWKSGPSFFIYPNFYDELHTIIAKFPPHSIRRLWWSHAKQLSDGYDWMHGAHVWHMRNNESERVLEFAVSCVLWPVHQRYLFQKETQSRDYLFFLAQQTHDWICTSV